MTTTIITITTITTAKARGACPMAVREVVCVRRGHGRNSSLEVIFPRKSGLVGVDRRDRTEMPQERVLFRLCVWHNFFQVYSPRVPSSLAQDFVSVFYLSYALICQLSLTTLCIRVYARARFVMGVVYDVYICVYIADRAAIWGYDAALHGGVEDTPTLTLILVSLIWGSVFQVFDPRNFDSIRRDRWEIWAQGTFVFRLFTRG